MSSKNEHAIVLHTQPLGFPWETRDPFLVTVHHDDRYPAGNEHMGPSHETGPSQEGWRMYHGHEVPGFPHHPHRGFETVTVVRRGFVDHSDSLGAAGRYGEGDVQWLTAGSGVQHAEMFPLVARDRPNPLDLFQIWVNLPAADKMAAPDFRMLWNEQIPRLVIEDQAGRESVVRIIAGQLADLRAPAPPPRSWASRPDSDFAILTISMAPHATLEWPAALPGTHRSLYFYSGATVSVGGFVVPAEHRADVRPDAPLSLVAGPDGAEILLLQAKPIGEPVVQYGPFVMSSREEIARAVHDFQTTGFGGWPWPNADPVHLREEGRFARYPDGRIERP